ncbi:MAG: acetate/propionate family kinase [Thermoleophilia bacterium]|nr:acetate/propionate family kinase [Thermoleophilia bacterium]
MRVLVVNAGSSTLKYALVGPGGDAEASGVVERIGDGARVTHRAGGGEWTVAGDAADHAGAMERMSEAFAAHGPDLDAAPPDVVGHRVVHGGTRFAGPAVIDDDVVRAIEELVPLAPLHNPPALAAIAATLARFPGAPQVAVFDTSFHLTLPAAAVTYAVPGSWRRAGARRHGAHGISHEDCAARAARMLGDPPGARVVVLHLGNGASACAVRDGASVETSMGLTPLEGLVMGTRPGDLDPGVVPYVRRVLGLDEAAAEDALWHGSGLKGLAGESDFRALSARAEAGDGDATAALDVVVHRLVKYVGAYAAVLGGLDALVFTGGIGEHSAALRARVVGALGLLGLALDDAANAGEGDRVVSSAASLAAVLVLEAREERAIARACLAALG